MAGFYRSLVTQQQLVTTISTLLTPCSVLLTAHSVHNWLSHSWFWGKVAHGKMICRMCL